MKYKTIYADPPWPEYGGGKIKRGVRWPRFVRQISRKLRENIAALLIDLHTRRA
jgi:hypothetical protein